MEKKKNRKEFKIKAEQKKKERVFGSNMEENIRRAGSADLQERLTRCLKSEVKVVTNQRCSRTEI